MSHFTQPHTQSDLEAPKYWTSYSRYSGLAFPDHDHTFSISIVLDAGVWRHFSGIRLVVIYQERDGFITVTDHHESARYSPRDQLAKRTQAMQASAAIMGRHNDESASGTRLPIFEAVYELTWIRPFSSWHRSVSLSMAPGRFRDLAARGEDRLRVAYDRTYPCSESTHSVFASLRTNLCVHEASYIERPRTMLDLKPRAVGYRRSRAAATHHYRILPVHGRLPFAHHRLLPLPILRRVVKHVILDHQEHTPSWRGVLLSLGLVCKAWTPVLDLFLEFHDIYETVGITRPSAVSVARYLEREPQRARLMRVFSTRNYTQCPGDPGSADGLGWSRALLTILGLASSVEEVYLDGFDEDVLPEFLGILSELKNVVKCTVETKRWHPAIHSLRMSEVQRTTAGWSGLQSLTISSWASERETGSADEIPSRRCDLRQLTLTSGRLHGYQFIHFIQSPRPCLQELHLESVWGVYNHDLFLFLSVVAPSLVVLTLKTCHIPRCDPKHEEYALDRVMPMLSGVRRISVSGDHVSALSIARRRRMRVGAGDNEELYPRLYPASISIDRAPAMDPGDLTRALRVGCWGSILLTTDGPCEELEVAAEVARRRGIDFRYWSTSDIPFYT